MAMLLVKTVSPWRGEQRIGDALHRAAGGENHRGAVGHQAGRQPADRALGVGVDLLADGDLGLAALERERAAVGLAQQVAVRQQQQVAADGLARYLQLALDLGDR